MAANTKQRSEQIYAVAASLVEAAGGPEKIDQLPRAERRAALRGLAKQVASAADCHIDTAKRNVAKALRRERYNMMQRWGGPRPGAGRPREKIETEPDDGR